MHYVIPVFSSPYLVRLASAPLRAVSSDDIHYGIISALRRTNLPEQNCSPSSAPVPQSRGSCNKLFRCFTAAAAVIPLGREREREALAIKVNSAGKRLRCAVRLARSSARHRPKVRRSVDETLRFNYQTESMHGIKTDSSPGMCDIETLQVE